MGRELDAEGGVQERVGTGTENGEGWAKESRDMKSVDR